MHIIVAVILYLASGSKLLLLAPQLVTFGLSAVPVGEFLLCILEVLAASSLLVTPRSRSVWLINAMLFGAFTMALVVKMAVGQPLCGCLGSIPVAPTAMFGLDLVVCALCGYRVWRPVGGKVFQSGRHAAFVAVVVCSLVLILGAAWTYFGNQALVVPGRISVRRLAPESEFVSFEVPMENRSFHPVRLLGMAQSCGLEIDNLFPAELQPGERMSIRGVAKLLQSHQNNLVATELRLTVFTDQSSKFVTTFVTSVSVMVSEDTLVPEEE